MVKGDPSAMMDTYENYDPIWTEFLRCKARITLTRLHVDDSDADLRRILCITTILDRQI
jgi:hypothetical protein